MSAIGVEEEDNFDTGLERDESGDESATIISRKKTGNGFTRE